MGDKLWADRGRRKKSEPTFEIDYPLPAARGWGEDLTAGIAVHGELPHSLCERSAIAYLRRVNVAKGPLEDLTRRGFYGRSGAKWSRRKTWQIHYGGYTFALVQEVGRRASRVMPNCEFRRTVLSAPSF